MEEFLPSEIARLVLGYLKEVDCEKTWATFFEESDDLLEHRRLSKQGRPCTTDVRGKSLLDILKAYCAVIGFFESIVFQRPWTVVLDDITHLQQYYDQYKQKKSRSSTNTYQSVINSLKEFISKVPNKNVLGIDSFQSESACYENASCHLSGGDENGGIPHSSMPAKPRLVERNMQTLLSSNTVHQTSSDKAIQTDEVYSSSQNSVDESTAPRGNISTNSDKGLQEDAHNVLASKKLEPCKPISSEPVLCLGDEDSVFEKCDLTPGKDRNNRAESEKSPQRKKPIVWQKVIESPAFKKLFEKPSKLENMTINEVAKINAELSELVKYLSDNQECSEQNPSVNANSKSVEIDCDNYQNELSDLSSAESHANIDGEKSEINLTNSDKHVQFTETRSVAKEISSSHDSMHPAESNAARKINDVEMENVEYSNKENAIEKSACVTNEECSSLNYENTFFVSENTSCRDETPSNLQQNNENLNDVAAGTSDNASGTVQSDITQGSIHKELNDRINEDVSTNVSKEIQFVSDSVQKTLDNTAEDIEIAQENSVCNESETTENNLEVQSDKATVQETAGKSDACGVYQDPSASTIQDVVAITENSKAEASSKGMPQDQVVISIPPQTNNVLYVPNLSSDVSFQNNVYRIYTINTPAGWNAPVYNGLQFVPSFVPPSNVSSQPVIFPKPSLVPSNNSTLEPVVSLLTSQSTSSAPKIPENVVMPGFATPAKQNVNSSMHPKSQPRINTSPQVKSVVNFGEKNSGKNTVKEIESKKKDTRKEKSKSVTSDVHKHSPFRRKGKCLQCTPKKVEVTTSNNANSNIPVLSISESPSNISQTSASEVVSKIECEFAEKYRSPFLKLLSIEAEKLLKETSPDNSSHVRCLNFDSKSSRTKINEGTLVSDENNDLKSNTGQIENGVKSIGRKNIPSSQTNKKMYPVEKSANDNIQSSLSKKKVISPKKKMSTPKKKIGTPKKERSNMQNVKSKSQKKRNEVKCEKSSKMDNIKNEQSLRQSKRIQNRKKKMDSNLGEINEMLVSDENMSQIKNIQENVSQIYNTNNKVKKSTEGVLPDENNKIMLNDCAYKLSNGRLKELTNAENKEFPKKKSGTLLSCEKDKALKESNVYKTVDQNNLSQEVSVVVQNENIKKKLRDDSNVSVSNERNKHQKGNADENQSQKCDEECKSNKNCEISVQCKENESQAECNEIQNCSENAPISCNEMRIKESEHIKESESSNLISAVGSAKFVDTQHSVNESSLEHSNEPPSGTSKRKMMHPKKRIKPNYPGVSTIDSKVVQASGEKMTKNFVSSTSNNVTNPIHNDRLSFCKNVSDTTPFVNAVDLNLKSSKLNQFISESATQITASVDSSSSEKLEHEDVEIITLGDSEEDYFNNNYGLPGNNSVFHNTVDEETQIAFSKENVDKYSEKNFKNLQNLVISVHDNNTRVIKKDCEIVQLKKTVFQQKTVDSCDDAITDEVNCSPVCLDNISNNCDDVTEDTNAFRNISTSSSNMLDQSSESVSKKKPVTEIVEQNSVSADSPKDVNQKSDTCLTTVIKSSYQIVLENNLCSIPDETNLEKSPVKSNVVQMEDSSKSKKKYIQSLNNSIPTKHIFCAIPPTYKNNKMEVDSFDLKSSFKVSSPPAAKQIIISQPENSNCDPSKAVSLDLSENVTLNRANFIDTKRKFDQHISDSEEIISNEKNSDSSPDITNKRICRKLSSSSDEMEIGIPERNIHDNELDNSNSNLTNDDNSLQAALSKLPNESASYHIKQVPVDKSKLQKYSPVRWCPKDSKKVVLNRKKTALSKQIEKDPSIPAGVKIPHNWNNSNLITYSNEIRQSVIRNKKSERKIIPSRKKEKPTGKNSAAKSNKQKLNIQKQNIQFAPLPENKNPDEESLSDNVQTAKTIRSKIDDASYVKADKSNDVFVPSARTKVDNNVEEKIADHSIDLMDTVEQTDEKASKEQNGNSSLQISNNPDPTPALDDFDDGKTNPNPVEAISEKSTAEPSQLDLAVASCEMELRKSENDKSPTDYSAVTPAKSESGASASSSSMVIDNAFVQNLIQKYGYEYLMSKFESVNST